MNKELKNEIKKNIMNSLIEHIGIANIADFLVFDSFTKKHTLSDLYAEVEKELKEELHGVIELYKENLKKKYFLYIKHEDIYGFQQYMFDSLEEAKKFENVLKDHLITMDAETKVTFEIEMEIYGPGADDENMPSIIYKETVFSEEFETIDNLIKLHEYMGEAVEE